LRTLPTDMGKAKGLLQECVDPAFQIVMDLLLTTSGRQGHLLELHHVGVKGHCKDPREALAKPRET
jgi:hypothetical protein